MIQLLPIWYVFILFFTLPFYAFAEPELLEATYLDPLIVTADRWQNPYSEITDRVTVIHKIQIKKLPARDAAEALDYTPGIVMDRVGGTGSVVFPLIQGSSFYQTAVLINGVPFNDLANGLGNLGQIPSDLIETIEVVHGAGGVEWGAALGGVINVITTKPRAIRKNSVKLGAADYSTGFGAANLQLIGNKASMAVGAEIRNGTGSKNEKRSVDRKNLISTIDVNLSPSSVLSLQGYTFHGNIGSGEYSEDLKGYWERYLYRTSGFSAMLEARSGVHAVKFTGYYQSQVQDTLQNMDGVGQIGDAHLDDEIVGGSLIWNADLGLASATGGADFKNGELKSNGLTEDSYEINTNGVFLKLKKEVSSLVLQGGVRQSYEDFYGSFTGFNVGALYKFIRVPMELRATVSRGYTSPPLAARFIDISKVLSPNPELTTEKSLGYQVGLKSKFRTGINFDVNAFLANVTDAINISQNDDGLSIYKNFEEFRRQGVEAEIKWLSNSGYHFFVNTLQQKIVDLGKDEIVKDQVRASYAIGAGYSGGVWSALLTGTYKDWNASELTNAKDKKWLVSAKTGYEHRIKGGHRIKTAISFFNLTNVALATQDVMPKTPPRQVEVSIEYLF